MIDFILNLLVDFGLVFSIQDLSGRLSYRLRRNKAFSNTRELGETYHGEFGLCCWFVTVVECWLYKRTRINQTICIAAPLILISVLFYICRPRMAASALPSMTFQDAQRQCWTQWWHTLAMVFVPTLFVVFMN